VDAIVARCLQKQPEHRFQSIHELATALQPLAGRASAWPDAGAWSQGRAVPQGGRASSPEGAPVRGPQPEIAPAGVAQPNIAPGASLQPGAAEVPGSPTGSTWGRTAGASISSKGSGKVLVAAGLALGVAALGGAGAWFARRPPSDAGAASQAAEVAPAAADVGSPAAQATSGPSVTASAAVEVPGETTQTPAPEASAKGAQAGSSRSVKPKGSASGGSSGASATPAPTPAPAPAKSTAPEAKPSVTSAPPTPPPPPPPATSAPAKPKYQGVF
jgi:serine/threonine-protein kinase